MVLDLRGCSGPLEQVSQCRSSGGHRPQGPQAWIDLLCLSSLVIPSAVGEAPATRVLNSGIRPNGLPIVTRLKDRTRHRNPRSNSMAAQKAGYTHSSRKELFAVHALLSISSLLWFRRPWSLTSSGACTLVLSRHTKTPLTGFAVLTQEPSRPSSRTWFARPCPVSLPLGLQGLAVCDHPVSTRPRAVPRATRRSGFSLRSSHDAQELLPCCVLARVGPKSCTPGEPSPLHCLQQVSAWQTATSAILHVW